MSRFYAVMVAVLFAIAAITWLSCSGPFAIDGCGIPFHRSRSSPGFERKIVNDGGGGGILAR